jgi:hypothetical protein
MQPLPIPKDPFVLSYLKGAKHDIFGSGVLTQIMPVWVGYLGTRSKNLKSLWFLA